MGVTRHRGASPDDLAAGVGGEGRSRLPVPSDGASLRGEERIVRLVSRDERAGGGGVGAESEVYRYAVDGWGVGEIVTRHGVLVAHALPSRQRRLSPRAGGPRGGRKPPEVTLAAAPSRESDDFVPDLCRRFADHLAGTAVSYDDVPVEETSLTSFQRELLAAARSLGWGEVVTYGGLARLARRPRAARAAGSFCAGNRWSLVVPCHRVVAAGKDEPFELGGYGSAGPALKRRLLALEGTHL